MIHSGSNAFFLRQSARCCVFIMVSHNLSGLINSLAWFSLSAKYKKSRFFISLLPSTA